MNFTCIKTEGGLLPVDLLESIAVGEAEAQRPQDFALPKTRRMADEIAAAWSDARAYWDALKHAQGRLKETDTGTSERREQWVVPLLKSLGYHDLLGMRRASEVGGRTYFISHRAGQDEEGPPVHIEGFNINLDHRSPTGRPRISPHALIQEYLNRTEALWGIVTNGHLLRLLRDSARITRPAYVEFDLEQMMESERYAEFVLFYRLVHRTRLPRGMEDAHECVLERYYQQAIEAGGRVREHLRDNVEEALKIFGNGFLRHPANAELAEKFRNGNLRPEFYYRQLLRLIYRLLFLMVSEERKLVGPDPTDEAHYRIYWDYYSISRLRPLVESHFVPDERHSDAWESVGHTFRLHADENIGRKLGVAPLNGDLFSRNAIPDLENAQLSNADFLRGFAHLSLYREKNITRRVNYAHLDVEELGSVYESLLDFHPVVAERNGKLGFELVAGMERKLTGSHCALGSA